MRRKGVALWNFLLGCVRLGHRYMENQLPSQVDPVSTRSRGVDETLGFCPASVGFGRSGAPERRLATET